MSVPQQKGCIITDRNTNSLKIPLSQIDSAFKYNLYFELRLWEKRLQLHSSSCFDLGEFCNFKALRWLV